MDTIVVGYDGSQPSERALGRAADFAEALAARLVVVSVSSSPHGPAGAPLFESEGPLIVPGISGQLPSHAPAPTRDRAREPAYAPEHALAQRLLERARATLEGRRIKIEYVAEYGAAAERLLDIAESRAADLIVVGSREHGVLERLLARPVDETVARRAGADVLLVH